MKIISWNLNGLMPCIENGSLKPLPSLDPDIICFQETRTSQRPTVFPGFSHYWLSGEREGYAGVLTMSRAKPLSVRYGLGDPDLDKEARLLTLEFDKFWSVNAYFPRSEGDLERHAFRMAWDKALLELLLELDQEKPVILCGDCNVTRSPLDFYPENTRLMWAEEGYASEERDDFETMLENGFVDVYRYLHPDQQGTYTWWSNRKNKRAENRGWRLDYFCISERILFKAYVVRHFAKLEGSDHCPIMLGLTI